LRVLECECVSQQRWQLVVSEEALDELQP